ncbi:hypothetical protein SH580_02510 [Coraliomargarita algicola]|uniref:Uncharacterized protein n=1 Tax=Coraliomargarita algicola TaxID=3092156 RepID=A0ABZ0RUE7_9BACT|nr:hypothetical protein [Coraliomargarita sp. J2-16]WPJ96574.1 hypothetical protein SH580_02510 [Coraliomargarita sp. J2-16]
MSEKATLLTSIPPVKTSESNDGRQPLLAPTPVLSKVETVAEAKAKVEPKVEVKAKAKAKAQTKQAQLKVEPKKTTGKVSLLSQTRDVTPPPAQPKAVAPVLKSTAGEPVKSALLQPVEVEPVSESGPITSFQMVTYASFVLNFLLAGAVAVILFKKAMKLAEERFVVSAKTMAIAGVVIMLHGFFATYLYASHINNSVSTAPLFLTMAVWVLVGPAVGFITRNLLARGDQPNTKAALIDAGIYGLIFFLTACGVSSGIKTNAALLSSILAGFLMIVPIARSMTAFGLAKARHQELNQTSDKILIYGLLLIPALLPILAFANVCGLSDAVTLFLINFITFDFVLVVSLSLIASADEFLPEVEESQDAAEEVPVAVEHTAEAELAAEQPMPVAEHPEPVTESTLAPVQEMPAKPARPEKLKTGNPDDPIIQFLNGEIDDEEPAAIPEKPAPVSKPAPSRPMPPRKPGRPGITPPKKPGSSPAAKAPNAPSRLKAPSKPKKRF